MWLQRDCNNKTFSEIVAKFDTVIMYVCDTRRQNKSKSETIALDFISKTLVSPIIRTEKIKGGLRDYEEERYDKVRYNLHNNLHRYSIYNR